MSLHSLEMNVTRLPKSQIKGGDEKFMSSFIRNRKGVKLTN
jgi:hypothetical protein